MRVKAAVFVGLLFVVAAIGLRNSCQHPNLLTRFMSCEPRKCIKWMRQGGRYSTWDECVEYVPDGLEFKK